MALNSDALRNLIKFGYSRLTSRVPASRRLPHITGTQEKNGSALRWAENHPAFFRTSPKRPKLLEASRLPARCNNRASCSQNRTSLGGPSERVGKRSTATTMPPRQSRRDKALVSSLSLAPTVPAVGSHEVVVAGNVGKGERFKAHSPRFPNSVSRAHCATAY